MQITVERRKIAGHWRYYPLDTAAKKLLGLFGVHKNRVTFTESDLRTLISLKCDVQVKEEDGSDEEVLDELDP